MTKKVAPAYVDLNGAKYERMGDNTVEIELELDEDTLDKLDCVVRSEGFVSRGEALRYILREAMTVESLREPDYIDAEFEEIVAESEE